MNYSFNFTPVFRSADLLLEGVLLTIELSAIAMALGLIVGTVLAVCKLYGPRALNFAVTAYVEFIRNTPFLAQLFIIFFGLPALGVELSAKAAAIIGLTIYMGAYATEIMRAGIQAIPKAQAEAGLCLGMTYFQVFRHVIFFPALRLIYPALTSQFVLLLLGSSLVSLISARELFHIAAFIDSRTFLPFEVYLVVSGLYLALSLGFRAVFWALGRAMFARA